jgi:hypothetical protein
MKRKIKMNGELICEVIDKLIGKIEPIGVEHIDDKRYKNLQNFIIILDTMIYNLISCAGAKDNDQHSMERTGTRAFKEIIEIKNILEDYIKENK